MALTAKTILHNDQDCGDAIQEAIVKAFQKIDTLRQEKYAKTWLMRILINECYSLLRQKADMFPWRKGIFIWGSRGEKDYSNLYSAVNSLKEELRIPVILYYGEDFSIREIAQILEITEGAVQKRLFRARMQLRDRLTQMEVPI